ncbi:magnesium transporter [Ignisphaera aggregans DSM 17230]|uniref:Magnesium transporter MgtE n=1 Tax=Ignisphaera aggregans (strain DSM 17230 / JCM 13409 / AQ1.S1) TaxID=583356 RepID=E0SNG8_IGNAA|nr:magnesium transporter [Ignisphaera aggregans DSM 17230]
MNNRSGGSFGVSIDYLVDEISRLLDENAHERVISILRSLDSGTLIDLILRLDSDYRAELLVIIPIDMFLTIANKLPDEVFFQFVTIRGVDELAKAIVNLPFDEATDIVGRLPYRQRIHVLRLLPRDVASEIERLLRYSPESVGGIMTTQIPIFPMDMTVGEARKIYVDKDTKKLYDKHYYVYVVDNDGKLYGWIDVRSFLTKPANLRLRECAQKPPAVVRATADRETAARIAIQYDLMEIPVVDNGDKLVGIVTLDDILDVVVNEFSEDLLKYGGILEVIRGSYIASSPLRLAIKRFPMIAYLYLMNTITGSITAAFTSVIERVAILAAFLPMLADNSGNIGSQASSLSLRALVLGEIKPSIRDLAKVLTKEFTVTSLMLLFLAPISFGIGFFVSMIGGLESFKALSIASIVTLSLAVSCYISDLIGFLLPLLLAKMKIDPATASAPLITTIGDIATVSTYFVLATLLTQSLGL